MNKDKNDHVAFYKMAQKFFLSIQKLKGRLRESKL